MLGVAIDVDEGVFDEGGVMRETRSQQLPPLHPRSLSIELKQKACRWDWPQSPKLR